MSKPIKYSLIALAALIGLLVIGIGIIAATFDPNDYKPQIIRLVQEKKQRTLAIPGDIKLTFFPRLGADLGQVSLSEHKGSAAFAAIEHARVSLALMPLLGKRLVVDRVSIDGLRANIRRNQDGSTNFDDLLAKEEAVAGPAGPADEQPLQFAISGVDISNAHIRFDDLQKKRSLELTGLDLETGKIANGVPSNLSLAAAVKSSQPAVDARVVIKSGFTIDLERQHYILQGADAQIRGKLADFTDAVASFAGDADLQPGTKRFTLAGVRLTANGKRAAQALELQLEVPQLAVTDTTVTGGKLKGNAKITEGARTLTAQFGAPSFEGSPQAFKVPAIAFDAVIREGALDASAKLAGSISGDIDKMLFSSPQLKLVLSGKQGNTAIDGSLSTSLSANLKSQLIDLPNIAAAFSLPNPGGGVLKLNAAGRASVNLAKSSLTTALKGKLDESAFDAKFGMAPFSPAAYTFDIDIDQIDADRYLGKGKASTQPAAKTGTAAAAEKPLDLSGLRELRANGSVRIGALKANNLKASKLRADLRAGGGKIEVSTLSATLYGGSTSGSLSATASAAPRFTVRQNLSGIHIGPLLQDAIDKTPIEGRGNVNLDVISAGGSFAQIKKSLNGTVRLALQDGAVHGVNVAQMVRNAKAKIGELRGTGQAQTQTGTASVAEKTDFSEMTGSFRIANGVAHNDDLSVKSPLVRLGGAGDINLGEDRLDYLAKVTVVSTLQGQGGPELQALKGLTIPVRLSGPFTAIGWRIDFAGLAKEAAKAKVEEKKEEFKEKAREQIKDKLKGLFGK